MGLKIGIDIRFLAKGTRTGIEEYAINLLAALLPLRKDIEFKLFYNAARKKDLNFEWLKLPNVELKSFSIPNRFVFDPLSKLFYLPKADKLLGGVDVFFCPHFLLSPVSSKCKKVVVFHDLSFEYFPEFFPWNKNFWHKCLAPKKRAEEADKIIAVSESTKNDLVDLYKIPEEKIRVIYSGVEKSFGIINSEKCLPMKEKYGLPENYILYFGTLEPRKNLVGLIKAYEIFREKNQGKKAPCLVLAGAEGWFYEEIFQTAKLSRYVKDIIFTGFIDPVDKVFLYNLASIFVFPSFFEGFGFPPLEAMACGVPVICSHTSSFPEIAGDGALMVDPYNFGEIAWAINEIWQDNALKEDFISAGLNCVKKFTWEKAARETLDYLIF